MRLAVKFAESNQSFTTNFGEINNVSDGGYERGYEKGYEDGFDDGFDDAYKEEQEKSIDITENCTTEVTPDEDMALSKVIVKVDVPDKSEELGVIIDQSGVLDSTDGTVTEKVEQLIDKAELENVWYDASSCWTDNTSSLFYNNDKIKILPRINFENVTTMRYFAGYSTLERVDYYINTAKATNFYQAFMSCKKLKTIVGIDISNASSDGVYEMFKFCESLETIQEPLDFSTVLANMSGVFIGCYALKNVRFEKNCINVGINFVHCSKLTAESVQSIIDGLAPVETEQTLTLYSSIFWELPDEQFETITAKGWIVH